MSIIDCNQLHKRFADREILRSVSLTIRAGERVGLVGNSGSGKSTLARILAGRIELDGGDIATRRGARIDYLDQEPQLPAGESIKNIVLASLSEWNEARREYDRITEALSDASGDFDRLVAEQASAADTVERQGGWERLHEAEAIIDHLGLRDPERTADHLSGGERRRVALARLLVGSPDLAILDEPTNHLDIDSIEWLEEFLLERFKGAVLLITHDRYVLDRVATRTFELNDGEVISFDGGYVKYLEAKAARATHAERVERNRQNFLRRELDWFRSQPKARGTKQKARMNRIQDALDQSGPQREVGADLRTGSERLGRTILRISDLRLEREGQLLVDNLNLDLVAGERIGIVGPNAVGKTSLMLCILDRLTPTAGEYQLGVNTRLGYLDQTREGLDPQHSIREAVAGDRGTVEVAGEELRVGSYLERFLFSHPEQRKQIAVLSGGERARVCLAKLLCTRTNLLLLDEPSNDLDVSTLAALEEMLLAYQGSALVVSHDRWFLDRIATSILAFEGDGKLDLHRGNYSQYREKRRSREDAQASAPRSSEAHQPKTRQSDPDGTAPRKLSFAEKRELEGLLDEIDAAEGEVARHEATLGDPASYEGGGGAIAQIRRDLDAARARVDRLTARWEDLEERKAAAGG